ncbi:polyphosphate:AMP phosphotransferase [Stappia taiwanensis]|uniref:polyphosphate:AMP phosphotransferase n=1 Tax=Stappia taiwanensis TaxID=992267 RepID=UPI0019855069|nr:polyphosphate:AMP phosphotransferase [Stappia taiwanensis]GGF03368.1 polyphosphate:AMP phosphotransferase [Stappia taiwanensis]
MFQAVATPESLSKDEYKALEPALRTDLLGAQIQLIEEKPFSVIIVIAGVDGAGKNEAIARLQEWMDVRHVICNAYDAPSEDERRRPPLWRYWRDLPANGQTSIVVSSWYNEPLRDRVLEEIDEEELNRRLTAINRFEQLLADEGVLLLKFWFSLPPDVQKERLKPLKKKARGRRILAEWTDIRRSAKAQRIFEHAALTTSTAAAPWMVIPSQDPQARDLALGRCVEMALTRRLTKSSPVEAGDAAPEASADTAPASSEASCGLSGALASVDLTRSLDKDLYQEELAHWQAELAQLTDKKAFRDMSLVLAFEGNDAAGKGGAIRRVTRPLDPRRYRVHRIAAPAEEELARPYLWRFWRRVPRLGHTAIFDRSWYGRVLVERVEGYCSEADWRRAYGEINEFEAELGAADTLVVKFWLAISKEEQLARFEARKEIPYKQFKITEDDWRNRLKWDAYAEAAEEMIARTSTPRAPWNVVAAEDKRHARVTVLRTLCDALKRAM